MLHNFLDLDIVSVLYNLYYCTICAIIVDFHLYRLSDFQAISSPASSSLDSEDAEPCDILSLYVETA